LTLVAEMLAPRISVAGMGAAHRIRALLSADLDEFDMADKAREMRLTDEQLLAAWPVLNSTERAAWRALLKLERPDGTDRY